ncbi:MAG: hypothetical protein COA99_16145, partial [Moraxellaceae bacterium]
MLPLYYTCGSKFRQLALRLFFILPFTIFMSSPTLADSDANISYLFSLPLEKLLNLEITTVASNFEETNLQTSSSVDLVTREDWKKNSSRKLMEALEHLPSLMINVSTFSTNSA